ncbi:hypothetical protein HDU97_001771 [Phlyctochytrium planicorne]|nr:hypothetical protein HDU97_001771 [Phlyctochytrium planicorne]
MFQGRSVYRRRAHESFKKRQQTAASTAIKSAKKLNGLKDMLVGADASKKRPVDDAILPDVKHPAPLSSETQKLKLPSISSSKTHHIVSSKPEVSLNHAPESKRSSARTSKAPTPKPDASKAREGSGSARPISASNRSTISKRSTVDGKEKPKLDRASSRTNLVASPMPISRAASQASFASFGTGTGATAAAAAAAAEDEGLSHAGAAENDSLALLKEDLKNQKTADMNGRISLELLISKNIMSPGELSQDEALDYLTHLTHFRLDRCQIIQIDGLSTFTGITHLYLQYNQISVIENLGDLANLRFLTLADNKINSLNGLSKLKQLKFLDLARNLIVDVRSGIVSFTENPACLSPDYRLNLAYNLPNLHELDEKKITKQERQLADTLFGKKLSEDDLDTSDSDSSSENEEEKIDKKATDTLHEKLHEKTLELNRRISELNLFENMPESPFSKTVEDIIKRSKERQEQLKTDFSSRLHTIKSNLKESSRNRVAQMRQRMKELENDL